MRCRLARSRSERRQQCKIVINPQNIKTMLTKKDILKIIATVLIATAVFLGIIWLICEFAPLLLGALVFIPWLGAALADGANV